MFIRISYRWLLLGAVLLLALTSLTAMAYSQAATTCKAATGQCSKPEPANELLLESATRQFVSTLFY